MLEPYYTGNNGNISRKKGLVLDFLHVSSRELPKGTILKPYGLGGYRQKGLRIARLVLDHRPQDVLTMCLVSEMFEWQLNNNTSGSFSIMLIEQMLEKTRQELFPHRPSRIGSCFLFPEVGVAQGFMDTYRSGHGVVYKCEIESNYFQGDMSLVNKSLSYSADPLAALATMKERHVTYWKAEHTPIYPELIVPGVVRVVEPILFSSDWNH